MSSTNALAGLSGYDFSTIIDTMMTSYRKPEVSMQTQQKTLQTQQTAWQNAKTRLSALEKTLETLKNSETWTATKATASNTDLLSVTGGKSGVLGTYSIKVNALAQAQTAVTGVVKVADTTTSLGKAASSFSIKGKSDWVSINIKENASLNDIRDSINAKSGETNVKASIVQVGDGQYQIALTSTKTGDANIPTFNDDGGFLAGMGITLDSGAITAKYDPTAPAGPDNVSKGGLTVEAADAELVINGLSIKNSSNTITTAIEGITLSLNDADPSKTIKVTVDQDTSVAQKAVQSFIDQYNSLMTFIDDKTSYNKTTKTAGDLYADPTLRNIQSRLRSMMGSTWANAGGGYKLLSDLGISTSSDNYGEDASLTFDTEKFQKAMKENPQSVANLFGAAYNGVTPNETTTKDGTTRAQGISNILEEYLNPMVKFQGTLDQTNDSYTRQLKDLQDRMDDFEERAQNYEDMIKLKFSRLETALSALSQQSTSLTSMLSSLKSQTSSS